MLRKMWNSSELSAGGARPQGTPVSHKRSLLTHPPPASVHSFLPYQEHPSISYFRTFFVSSNTALTAAKAKCSPMMVSSLIYVCSHTVFTAHRLIIQRIALEARLDLSFPEQVFSVPGVTLMVKTHGGPISFTPHFFSRQQMETTFDYVRGEVIELMRSRRAAQRRILRNRLNVMAAQMAGIA